MSVLTVIAEPNRSQSSPPGGSPASARLAARGGLLQRTCECGAEAGVDGPCEKCRHEGASLQRRASGVGSPTVAPRIVNDVLRSPGQPLNATTRAFFEPRFGHDFSKVRVHQDSRAATSARTVGALAYTVGSDVVFAAGHYAPGSPRGRSLLAHELTHVIQQQAISTDPRGAIRIGSPSTHHEQEADRIASKIATHPSGAGDGPIKSSVVGTPEVSRLAATDSPLQRAAVGDMSALGATAPALPAHSYSSADYGSMGAANGNGPVPPGVSSARTSPPTSPVPTGSKAGPGSQGASPGKQQPTSSAAAAGPAPGKASPPSAGGKPDDSKGAPAVAAQAPAAAPAAETGAPPEAKAGEVADTAKAPPSPQQDPAFQAVTGRIKQASAKQKAHAPAAAKADEAQAAAVSPPAELKGRASAAQAAAIDREQPKPFDRAAFIKALMDKIASIAPKTLSEADDFKESGKVASLKGDLSKQADASKAQAQGDIPGKVQQAPDPSSIPPKDVTPLAAADAGPPPADVSAATAMPGPRPDSETSLAAGSASLDHQMAAASITEAQLQKGNEPAFQGALDAKKTAQADAVTAPKAFRQGEKTTLGQAQAEAKSAAQSQLTTMHGGRAAALGKVAGHQTDTKTKDEQARAQIAQQIEDRYQTTKSRTEARLKQLDTDSGAAFDQGATQAQEAFDNEVDSRMTRYKDDRYSGLTGDVLWAKDKLLGMPDEVNEFYVQARQNYIKRMTDLLNSIASIVETGLNEAKAIVAEGRKSIDDYLNGLPVALKALGHEAAQGIESKFGELEQSIDEKQGDLIDSLAQKYTEKLQQVDDKIAEMKKANGGLVDAAISAVAGVIDTIISLKNMLLNVLAKASAAIGMIIDDPIGFLGNLVEAVKNGFMGFVGKIGMYIEQGLMGWLFGALAQAGIEMPKSFDLKSILGLILQVLGLTYANIRARAVKILGPKVVSALETAAEIFKTLITEGPAGLWKWIKEKFNELKDAVLGSIKEWVITKVITAGVTWILSLLNPASAFIKACKAIYDVVMFFVERGAQIMALVNAILDSIISIAQGNIAGAAAYVESVLAKAVPVVISFLASLLGLGGISEKIKAIIEKIRQPINAIIDWVIHKAVDMVKAVGKLLGFGAEKPETQQDPAATETDEVQESLAMGSEGHTLTATLDASGITISMSSGKGHYLIQLIDAANTTVRGDKSRSDTEKADILKWLQDLRRHADPDEMKQDWRAWGGANVPQGEIKVNFEKFIKNRLAQIRMSLIHLAQVYGMTDLEAGLVKHTKRSIPDVINIRKVLYDRGSGWSDLSADLRTQAVGQISPKLTAVVNLRATNRPAAQKIWDELNAKHLIPAAASLDGFQTIHFSTWKYQTDHKIPLGVHWQETGYNSGDDKRRAAVVDRGNLEVVTKEYNESKGGEYFQPREVGDEFNSVVADCDMHSPTIDGKPFDEV